MGSRLTRRGAPSIYCLVQEYNPDTLLGNEGKYLCSTLKYRNYTREYRVENTNASSSFGSFAVNISSISTCNLIINIPL